MRAAVFRGPRDVAIESVDEPELRADDDVLIRVRRAAICGTDAAEWDHGPVLARPPVILGHEFTGVIAEVGSGVRGFARGDRVVSGAGVWCGTCAWCRAGRPNLCAAYETLGLHRDGGLAQLVRVPVRTLMTVPEAVSDDAAALAQPLAVAFHAVRRSRAVPGEACVVVGVGGIGAFVVAAAVARGLDPVIAIDVDDRRLATARTLGAAHALDASGLDLGDVIRSVSADGADVVIEASGAPQAPAAAIRGVKRGGRIVVLGLQPGSREIDLLAVSVRELELIGTLAHVCDEDLPEALIALGEHDLVPIVVDRTVGLDDLVPVAIHALVQKTATGKFLVDPSN
jgi:(R,R)-butanediol dehydrogenase / meso-butanediol dehydrogenase / diacetyl reductase